MWYDTPVKAQRRPDSKNWNSSAIKPVMTFDTVEDFWCLFNNLVKASELSNKSNYHLFREGLRPEWEEFPHGGCWEVKLGKDTHSMDQSWEFTLLAMIGDQFEDSDEVAGAVVRIRQRGSRLELWTRNSANESAARRIGLKLRQIVDLPRHNKLQYKCFSDLVRNRDDAKYEV